MRKPGQLPIDDYHYDLPEARIARYPAADRSGSLLLHYRSGDIRKRRFTEVPELLRQGDQLYFNVTRVVQARLVFRKETGGRIEIFILEPHEPRDHQLAYASRGPVTFTSLVGNAKKWKEGPLRLTVGDLTLTAGLVEKSEDKFIIRFSWDDPEISFAEVLEKTGSTPIPPYLKREAVEQDMATYQTVYAREEGSVAAPTAGLHFTEEILDRLNRKGVERYDLTLHVGAGTFIPVKDENAVNHAMHGELVTADRALLRALTGDERRIAVGTTSARTLESIYWLGVKAISDENFSFDNLNLDQWEAYDLDDSISLERSVSRLLKMMEQAGRNAVSFRTHIMITPGYEFKVLNGLITNFHQPKSTLLLLIAALVGEDWKEIYRYALENDFRFLSYGDSSLLLP